MSAPPICGCSATLAADVKRHGTCLQPRCPFAWRATPEAARMMGKPWKPGLDRIAEAERALGMPLSEYQENPDD